MRNITEKAFEAFRNNREFSRDNTYVTSDGEQTRMYLHFNCIARKCLKSGIVEITTAGWDTPTTKERLKPFARVSHSKRQLYLGNLQWTGEWTIIDAPGS
ncbi:hypothetical protein CL629_02190 [bacterium]|nr:hypothetical protein [bacterium]|tara:strand:+ start:5271 stop:5570 length:300 start_codon:yes stop_codon:yes gene_type:complete